MLKFKLLASFVDIKNVMSYCYFKKVSDTID